MKTGSLLALWAAVALGLAASCGAAAAQSDPPIPGITEARTAVVTVTPPNGWVLSVWQGGSVELGEFTPPGQTGPRYIDLLGYSVLPAIPELPQDAEALRAMEMTNAQRSCPHSLFRDMQPAGGWLNLARVCLGREGAADPNQLELEFATTTVTSQGIFRVWRSWRGTSGELVAMVAERTGATAPELVDPSDGSLVEAAFGDLVATLGPVMTADLARREVCDLGDLQHCSSFEQTLPDHFANAPWADRPVIAGFFAEGLGVVSRQQFLAAFGGQDDGTPNRVLVGLTPGEINWRDQAQVNHFFQLVALGQGADGGGLVIVEPAGGITEAERVAVRAHVIAAARRFQRPDQSPSVVRIYVPHD